MKVKSMIAVALCATLAVTMLVGCKKKVEGDADNSSKAPSSSAPAKVATGKLKEAHEAVKKAYGDLYIPSMPFEDAQLKEIFGVDKADCTEVIAEGPMISVHVDTFIGVEAKEGKADTVEAALKAYQKKLIEDSMQYPMNMPKVKASQVLKIDDYVFFVLLGDTEKITAATDEAGQLKVAQDEVKIATDAIKSVIK